MNEDTGYQQGYQQNYQQSYQQGYQQNYQQNNMAYQNGVEYQNYVQSSDGLGRRRILNPSSIISLLGAFLLYLGLTLPLVNFQHFHESVDIQYNLMKVCKNVGLISDMWAGIPFGIILAIIILIIFSFINIPLLKLVPCILVVAMLSLMLLDINNVIRWVTDVLEKYFPEQGIVVNIDEVIESLMYGVYYLIAGLAASLVSCFLKGARQ